MVLIKKVALHCTGLHVECSMAITFFIIRHNKKLFGFELKILSIFDAVCEDAALIASTKHEVNLIHFSVGAIVE